MRILGFFIAGLRASILTKLSSKIKLVFRQKLSCHIDYGPYWYIIMGQITVLFLYFENQKKSGNYENCEVSCAIWEEIFEDIDDTLKDLKATDDIIKSDLTRLNIENVEQNNRLQTVEDQAGLLESENRVLESSLKALEARLDILEEHSG